MNEWSPGTTAAATKRLILQKHYKNTEDNCVICLEPMKKSMCAYLPCTHAFHFTCLQHLIETRNYTCPLCRYDFAYLTGHTPVEELIFYTYDVYDLFLDLMWVRYGDDTDW
jgi:hypothetical protein